MKKTTEIKKILNILLLKDERQPLGICKNAYNMIKNSFGLKYVSKEYIENRHALAIIQYYDMLLEKEDKKDYFPRCCNYFIEEEIKERFLEFNQDEQDEICYKLEKSSKDGKVIDLDKHRPVSKRRKKSSNISYASTQFVA